MEPEDIANSIEDPEAGFETCPKRECGNPFFMSSGGKSYCPNPKCEYFDKEYHDAVKAMMIPHGIKDYDSLVKWFQMYVPRSKWERDSYFIRGSILNTIARFLADYESQKSDRPKEALAELLLHGHDGYRNNEELTREMVNEFMADDPEDFFAQFEDHYGIYYHRGEEEEY